MLFERIPAILRRINVGIAIAVGVLLGATVMFILVDIVLRELGMSLGGSDEISGYVMAATASWGLAFTLVELGHIRIDLFRLRLQSTGRCLLDVLSLAALTATTLVIAFQAWPVLSKSIARGSHANTPLETPLWIPQAIWFSGWVWFALTASLMLVSAIGMLAVRQFAEFDKRFGTTAGEGAH